MAQAASPLQKAPDPLSGYQRTQLVGLMPLGRSNQYPLRALLRSPLTVETGVGLFVGMRIMTITRNRNGWQKERARKKAIIKDAEGLVGSRTASPAGTIGADSDVGSWQYFAVSKPRNEAA
jgi:hypothetical protein